MTAAERKAALVAAGEQAQSLTDRLLMALLVEVIDLRKDLARREERRLNETGATTARPAEAMPAPAPRSSPGSGSRPEPGTFKFGRRKGEPLSGAPPSDLDWYANALRTSIDDPAKAKYRKYNEQDLAEVEAAMDHVVPSEAAQRDFAAGPGFDDDIPF